MSVMSLLRGNTVRITLGALCFGAVALMGGSSISGSARWVVGNVVVCIGSGQCRVYTSPTAFTTISVPNSPKQATGGVAWAGSFDAWVVDSRNQKVLRFSKNDPHTILGTIDTSVRSSGKPGPVVVDSAGTIYVGMYDSPTILKYDVNGSWVATISTGAGGAPAWMDLADDHKTMWFTTAGSPRQVQRIDLSTESLLDALPLSGSGTAGGLRLLPLVSPYDGSGGYVLADGLEIKGFGAGTASSYDVAGEDAWRTVTFEHNGTHFLAATAAGRIYRFPLAGGVGVLYADTGSSGISGLSVKGGVQLNIRPLQFIAGLNVQREAFYGNPLASGTDPFLPHSVGVGVSSVPEAFTLVTSANWVVTDGTCGTDPNDIDCRTDAAFGSDQPPSPRCIPYVSGNSSDCVFYRFEDEVSTLPSGVDSGSFLTFIDYLEPGKRSANPYLHPVCTGSEINGNPRMLRAPGLDPDPFTQDITVGVTRTTATDPIFGGGRGEGGSDYGAFDRCLNDATGQTSATINKPAQNTSKRFGGSIPFEVSVVDGNGQDVPNAVEPPNNMSLFIRHESGRTFLEPQLTPGSSPLFFQKRTIKIGKTTRIAYTANLETSGFLSETGQPLTGSYVGCVSSVNTDGSAPGLFAPVCVSFSLF